jgi:hypothetical protein
MVVHFCNPSTWEAEAEGLQVQDQPGIHSKSLCQKKEGEEGGKGRRKEEKEGEEEEEKEEEEEEEMVQHILRIQAKD